MFRFSAERADLQNLLAVIEVHQTEAPSDNHAPLLAEDLFDLLGCCGRGKIVVLRLAVEQKIPDGSSDNIRFIARVLQCGHNIGHILGDFRFQCHCLYGFVIMVSTPSSEGSRSG